VGKTKEGIGEGNEIYIWLVFECSFFWGEGVEEYGDIKPRNMFNFYHNIKSSIK